MNFNEALKIVRNDSCLAVAFIDKTKEIFIIEYDKNPEMFSDIIVYYSQDLGNYSSVEDLYSPLEFLCEYPQYEQLEFFKMHKVGKGSLSEIWECAIRTIEKNLILAPLIYR